MPEQGENGAHALNERETAWGRWATAHRLKRGWHVMDLAFKVRDLTRRSCNIGRVSEWEQGQVQPDQGQMMALRTLYGEQGPAWTYAAGWPKQAKPRRQGAVTTDPQPRLL